MLKSSHLTDFLDGILKKLPTDLQPGGLASLSSDLQNSLKAHLENTLAKFDLVTREEFDVQAQILARTRQKLQDLELVLAKLSPEATDTRIDSSE